MVQEALIFIRTKIKNKIAIRNNLLHEVFLFLCQWLIQLVNAIIITYLFNSCEICITCRC